MESLKCPAKISKITTKDDIKFTNSCSTLIFYQVSVHACVKRSTCRLSELFRGIITDGVSRDCSRPLEVYWCFITSSESSSLPGLIFLSPLHLSSLLLPPLLYTSTHHLFSFSGHNALKCRCPTEDSINYRPNCPTIPSILCSHHPAFPPPFAIPNPHWWPAHISIFLQPSGQGQASNPDHGGSDGKNRSNALNVKRLFLNFLEGQTSNTPNAYIRPRQCVAFRKCLETCDRCSSVLSTSGEESQNNNQKIHHSETRCAGSNVHPRKQAVHMQHFKHRNTDTQGSEGKILASLKGGGRGSCLNFSFLIFFVSV